ncbi:MAG: UvrD-helicase domain-containing protein [Bacteroidota bacterium]
MCAFDKIKDLIERNKSFVLEAGAGSGKTYTLIQTINYLIELKEHALKLKNQKIVCITYTNVAKNEIIERLENNPLVAVSTIHEFLWDCIKPYNRQLLIELDKLNTTMQAEKPEKFQLGLIDRVNEVIYNDSSYRDFEKGQLHHDDVITLSKSLFENYKLLGSIIANKYPYILVDEYQDTAVETADALITHLLKNNGDKVLLGFYGDSYQKIYDTGVGSLQSYVDSKQIEIVSKEENYRSSENVINLLNLVRTNLVQKIPGDVEKINGSVKFINCNNYPDPPKKGILEYEKSLVPQKNSNYDKVISKLASEGWNFEEGSDDKILIIANSRVAERGGFGDLYRIFSTRFGEGANEALLKRENQFTSFFLGSVDRKTSRERETGIEHLVTFYSANHFNSVMRFLKRNGGDNAESGHLKVHQDKKVISEKIIQLIDLRKTGTVGDVFKFVIENNLVQLPKNINKFQNKINVDITTIEDAELKEKIEKDIAFYKSLLALSYIEFVKLFKHTQNQTVFSTKHGTKGEEYRNVLVVIDDTSWKQKYNFQNFINATEATEDRMLRTRNLFYVSCSRAKENLVILSLSEMKDLAILKIKEWFGEGNFFNINEV